MADISMYFGNNCKIKTKCYRFRAIAEQGDNQSYATFDKQNNNNCRMYWSIEDAEGPLSDIVDNNTTLLP